ncbi:MAG: LarC family nickel insertion protein [Hyphomicrobiaceae bacterium]
MREDIDVSAVAAVHLDAVGGVAGDMFVAALVDALPALWTDCTRAVTALAVPPTVSMSIANHNDGVLSGRRLQVSGAVVNTQDHDGSPQHAHTHWRDIRERLLRTDLDRPIKNAAVGIFERLAEAEASVHAIAVDDVAFHEVGAWDSIIDIVAAAAIITRLGHCQWSIGPLPRGRGLVQTAHGLLPVPAPAAAELLRGFTLVDDGEDGERVTPTGAAILNYLVPTQAGEGEPRKLLSVGSGFGTRKLRDRSNMLRASLYGGSGEPAVTQKVEVFRFEVDDQSPEDLAIALEHVRGVDGVLDVCQWPVTAKKSRLGLAIQIIAAEGAAASITGHIFDETTTLGVRHSLVDRVVVNRTSRTIENLRVKVADRPSGRTAKAESDDVEAIRSYGGRAEARRDAERQALKGDGGSDDA